MNERYDEGAAYRGLPDLEDVPVLPDGAEFKIIAFEWAWSPHPYALTSEHVEYAAKHFSGDMGSRTIEKAEDEGITCGICQQQGVHFTWENHRRVIGMVIRPTVMKTPNDLVGLKEWLNHNEYQLSTELKIEVLVFAQPELVAR
jgi:hypothetical protein